MACRDPVMQTRNFLIKGLHTFLLSLMFSSENRIRHSQQYTVCKGSNVGRSFEPYHPRVDTSWRRVIPSPVHHPSDSGQALADLPPSSSVYLNIEGESFLCVYERTKWYSRMGGMAVSDESTPMRNSVSRLRNSALAVILRHAQRGLVKATATRQSSAPHAQLEWTDRQGRGEMERGRKGGRDASNGLCAWAGLGCIPLPFYWRCCAAICRAEQYNDGRQEALSPEVCYTDRLGGSHAEKASRDSLSCSTPATNV
uniref:Uncharacterized protein n=1 Tax=Setaria digitata TaxID=48799 RepID=A0A915PJ92_9BILA